MVGAEAVRESEVELRANASVLADALMQIGDPRGELLALELAAANTRDPVRARRIHRAAQIVRDRHPALACADLPELQAFPIQVRAGCVLAIKLEGEGGRVGEELEIISRLLDEGEGRRASEGPAASASLLAKLLEQPCADRLRRVQLGRITPEQLDDALAQLASKPGQLELLGLWLSGPEQLDAIAPMLSTIAARGLRIEYDQLSSVLLGAARERSSLASSSSRQTLRVLSLAGYIDPAPLADSPIDSLDAWCASAGDLEQIVALPQLRRLCLRHEGSLQPLAGGQGIEALALQVDRVEELAVLPELGRLRCLALDEPSGRAPSFMTGLPRLEGLELRGRLPAQLDDLRALFGLEQLGLRGTLEDPGPLDLNPLAELPRLRSLTLDLFSHTPRGCDRLTQLRSLTVIGRVDLRWFAGTALDELTITGGIPPRMLPRLAELGPLRRLRLPARVLQGIDGVSLARLLPELEELELFRASGVLRPEQFAAFPRLRRLVIEDLARGRARFFAEELPEITIETIAPVADPLGLAKVFDWRAESWPRDLH